MKLSQSGVGSLGGGGGGGGGGEGVKGGLIPESSFDFFSFLVTTRSVNIL